MISPTFEVMLLKNLDSGAQLVNGSRGVVESFKTSEEADPNWGDIAAQNMWPVVKFSGGLTRTITPEKWSVTLGSRVCDLSVCRGTERTPMIGGGV